MLEELLFNLVGIWFIDYSLTIFWVIAIMNSINMLDNMDAITTSVSISILFVAIGMALLVVSPSLWVYPCLIGVLAGLIAFLPYNWNPAKIYMGDTGSQFLGVFLAGLGVELFWNHQNRLWWGFSSTTVYDSNSCIRRTNYGYNHCFCVEFYGNLLHLLGEETT